MGGGERARPTGERADAVATIDDGEKLTDRTGFDVLGHHWAREDHGKQEKLEATSMESSEQATMVRW